MKAQPLKGTEAPPLGIQMVGFLISFLSDRIQRKEMTDTSLQLHLLKDSLLFDGDADAIALVHPQRDPTSPSIYGILAQQMFGSLWR